MKLHRTAALFSALVVAAVDAGISSPSSVADKEGDEIKSTTGLLSRNLKGSKSSKGAKPTFDDCVFTNPAIVFGEEYVQSLSHRVGLAWTTLDRFALLVVLAFLGNRNPDCIRTFLLVCSCPPVAFCSIYEHAPVGPNGKLGQIEHAVEMNEIYEDLVAQWIDGTTFPITVRKAGKEVGKYHEPILAGLPVPIELPEAVCVFAIDMVEKMEDTCYYEDNKEAYVNVAALLMKGFSQGLKLDINILRCKDTLDGDTGTFNQEYGKYLTKRVKQIVK